MQVVYLGNPLDERLRARDGGVDTRFVDDDELSRIVLLRPYQLAVGLGLLPCHASDVGQTLVPTWAWAIGRPREGSHRAGQPRFESLTVIGGAHEAWNCHKCDDPHDGDTQCDHHDQAEPLRFQVTKPPYLDEHPQEDHHERNGPVERPDGSGVVTG